MAMTWPALMDQFSFEYRRLQSAPVITFGFAAQPVLNPNELRDEELGCAARVDLLVRDFARTGRWPALDERERYFLRERIRFAYEYASIAQVSVKRPLGLAKRAYLLNEHRRLLEWLLIDVWRESGVVNWLSPFFAFAEGNGPVAMDWQMQVAE